MPMNDDDLPGPLSEAFRQAFRQHPAGVAIVTADPGEGPVALTVSSLISVSPMPPTVAFSLSAASSSAAGIRRAPTMIIHMLRLQDLELAQLCATSGADRFGPGVNWTRLPTGEPLYTDVGIWFRARLLHELPVSGATLIVAELMGGQVTEVPEESSIVYLNRRWHSLRPTPEGVH